jgi:hypothetical protein
MFREKFAIGADLMATAGGFGGTHHALPCGLFLPRYFSGPRTAERGVVDRFNAGGGPPSITTQQ